MIPGLYLIWRIKGEKIVEQVDQMPSDVTSKKLVSNPDSAAYLLKHPGWLRKYLLRSSTRVPSNVEKVYAERRDQAG